MGGGIDEEEKHWDINGESQRASGDIRMSGDIRPSEKVPLMGEGGGDIMIAHVAGTIEIDERPRLKKLLFRATRGKALTYFKEFNLPRMRIAGEWVEKQKAVYIVVFQEGRQIREKITRICDSFMGQRFDLPPLAGIPPKIQEVKMSIAESKSLTEHSKKQLKNYLLQINQIGHDGGKENKPGVD
jgi:hypothetical protein